MGPGAAVVRARRMHGGITSVVHAVDVVDGAGRHRRLVLRRYPPGGIVDDPAENVEAEVRSLTALRAAAVAHVPQLVAVDPDGRATGLPAVLSTRLPGRPLLAPPDPVAWAVQLADRVVAHLDALGGVDATGLPAYERWHEGPDTPPPPWLEERAAWGRALSDLPASRAAVQPIHRDLNPSNVLWHRRAPEGIVDWVHLCRGPVEEDLGRCRVNIWLLTGRAAADAYLARIEAAGASYDRRWDWAVLADLGPYVDDLLAANRLGAHLTLPTLRRRAVEVLHQ